MSLPLYDGALKDMALECVLPGLRSPMVERVAMVVDYAGAASSFVMGLGAMEVAAYLRLHNPFNASIEVRAMHVRVRKGATLMAWYDLTVRPLRP